MYELTISFPTAPGNLIAQSRKASEIAERFGFTFAGGEGKALRFRRDALPDDAIMARLCEALRTVAVISTWGIEELKA